MARQLMASGHEIVADPADADKVIINTCAVTREAARDSRSRTRRYHRLNQSAEIILTGCYATITPEELSEIGGVGQIVPNRDKEGLVQLIDPDISAEVPFYDHEPILREYLATQIGRTRAFIKVQDGCDNHCTFCITTVARGHARSRELGDIVSEIQGLATAGYKEAVLTGVHLGSYGKDMEPGVQLATLVKTVLDDTDIRRLRLSSLEPWDIPDDFFDLWSNPRLLPHLHIPLQSGSDNILRRMARRTNRSSFRKLASSARQAIPNLNLSTDLIAGFPGESEKDFEDTFEFVREMDFSRLHVFTFSRRTGTAAALMDGQVPKQIRKSRTRSLIDLGKELSLTYHRRNDGRTLSVLWEQAEDSDLNGQNWVGYSENYIRVRARCDFDLTNLVTPTLVSEPRAGGMSGIVQKTAEG
jgi:threonylcarbamoyladenosine tRNA methylthiotransferase MtaB